MVCSELQRAFADHKAVADGAVLLVAIVAFAAAYRWRTRPTRAALCVVFGGLCLAGAMAMDDFLHAWDERYHAVVAKSLLAHPWVPTLYDPPLLDRGLEWLRAGVWIHKPPLTLYLIAAALRLLGPCELAVRIPSLVLAGVAIFATFRIGAILFDNGVGLIAAFLHAINGQLLDLVSGRQPTDHPDSLFVSLIAIGVWAALVQTQRGKRRDAVVVGLVAGFAILTKWLPALLILGLWAVAMPWSRTTRWRRASDLAIALVTAALLALPWQLYTRLVFAPQAAWESAHVWRHLWEPLDEHHGSWLFHLARIPRFFGEVSPLVVAWFVWTKWRTRPGLLVILWLAVPYAFFSLVATKMANYVMIAAPAMFLILAVGVVALQENRVSWRRVAAGVAMALLVGLPLRFAIERWKPFRSFERERAMSRELRDIPSAYGSAPLVIFGAEHAIETMFYTDYLAYAEVPDGAERQRCVERGYRVVVWRERRAARSD